VGERGGQIDHAGGVVDGGRLHDRNFVLAERFTHNVEAAGEWGIAEAALTLPWPTGAGPCCQRLFRINEFGIELVGQSFWMKRR